MNKRIQQILVVVLLATFVLTPTANAGFFDWFIGKSAATNQTENSSFNHLYASTMTASIKAAVEAPMIINNSNAVVAAASPAEVTSKATRRIYTVEVSGYNSEVAQTDDSPFITANGSHVRDGIVAANMFPFGTVIKIPSLYGDKIFIVEDRMNKRYQNNVDIWFADKTEARKLGRRTVQIEVIK